jgi:hypothetical protein
METSNCKICKVDFKTTKHCTAHVKSVHGKYPDELKALQDTNIGRERSLMFKMKCNFCSEKFLNLHVLKIHAAHIHKEEQTKTDWKCEFCNYLIKPRKHRSTFINTHMKKAHNIGTGIGISSQIVQPKENEALKNFNKMMQMMMRKE